AALAVTAALATSTAAQAFTPPPFPRIGGVQIGQPFNYNDPSYEAQLAKQSVMVLGYYPGMAPGGQSMDSIVQAIKAINPNALVFLYTDSDDQFNTPSANEAFAPMINQLNAMHWWLYTNSSDTTLVPSFFGDGGDTINNTPYTPKDSSGDDSIDWITKWFVSNWYTPNPHIDGLYMDNVFTQPQVAGDWYRNGQVLAASASLAGAALQAGYERWFSLARQLMPGKYQIGNIATWYQGGASLPAGYQDMADGGIMEGLLGKSWSVETYAGWQAMESQYYATMGALNGPKLGIFNQWGSPTDYQSMRYGLASCLMDDGYYSFTSTSAGYSGVVWFDEYNANLGQAISSPPTAAWQNGVWRRDFTNGIALVNPKGNGPQTVQLGGTFVKL
ncbi:MAG: putative glycoside hydrolase, partial [Terriglobales bacterium]